MRIILRICELFIYNNMINNRIDELINYFSQGNKSLFSKQIGVTPSVIGNITGERKGNPSFDVINKIINAFVNINANWLITGHGEMLQTAIPIESIQSVSPPNDDIIVFFKEQLKEKDIKIEKQAQEIGALKNQNIQLRDQVMGLDQRILKLSVSLSQFQSTAGDAPSVPAPL